MSKRSRDDASTSPLRDDSESEPTELLIKQDHLPTTKLRIYEGSRMSTEKPLLQCSLPPHSASLAFTSLSAFEVHYAKEHTNRCAECNKNLPSAHFLTLHIDENHNPLREALADRGEKTYACFLPDCERKCSTPQKRRLHMIDKHNFPKVYNFRLIDQGIDNVATLLHEGRRRRVSVTSDQPLSYRQRGASVSQSAEQSRPIMNGDRESTRYGKIAEAKHDRIDGDQDVASSQKPVSEDVGELEKAFAALQFVPRSVLTRK